MGTFGSFSLDGKVFYTIERPWFGNEPRVSCIPAGLYDCLPRPYFRGGYDSHEITNVKGRSHILFHCGNTMHDTEGCIIVGTRLGCLRGLWAVTDSRLAFDEFQRILGGIPFKLAIVNAER